MTQWSTQVQIVYPNVARDCHGKLRLAVVCPSSSLHFLVKSQVGGAYSSRQAADISIHSRGDSQVWFPLHSVPMFSRLVGVRTQQEVVRCPQKTNTALLNLKFNPLLYKFWLFSFLYLCYLCVIGCILTSLSAWAQYCFCAAVPDVIFHLQGGRRSPVSGTEKFGNSWAGLFVTRYKWKMYGSKR